MASASPTWTQEYIISTSVPTVEEYYNLRTSSGLSPPPLAGAGAENIAKALANSVHCLVARHKETNEAAGMLRLSGDGHIFLLVTDMAVDPKHQRKGLGKALVESMANWLDKNAPHAYTTLVADPGFAPAIYSRFGWVNTKGTSMARSSWEN